MTPNKSIEIYLSCSQDDEELGSKLAEHLRALELDGVSTVWQSNEISAGAERDNEIEKHLNSASIILLLISASFFNSEEHWKRDVPRAMERHKAEQKPACVIPVLLRPCDWTNKQFSHLQFLPRNKKAITSWQNQDEAFTEVAEEIRKAIERKSDYISLPQTDERRFKIPWRSLRTLLFASMGVSGLVIIIRLGGILQSLELAAYDQLMSFQLSYFPKEQQQDEKLLIIKITEEDAENEKKKAIKSKSPVVKKITKEDAEKEKEKAIKSKSPVVKLGTLTDASLAQLLEKLKNYDPRAIGLDIYRDYPSGDGKLIDLLIDLLKKEKIFALCKAPKTEDSDDKGIDPPPETEILSNRIGFSDIVRDKDSILRRQLLSLFLDNPKSGCKSRNAFNLVLARSYLASTGNKGRNQEAFDSHRNLQDLIINDVVLEQLKNLDTGGYRGTDFTGYQILLDYRSFCQDGNNCSPYNIAKTLSLKQVLDENLLKKEDVVNRIVLIGVEANSYANDRVDTPIQQDTPGFIVQAQMLSYLLRIALGEQRQLRVGSLGYEILWILAWSLVGGILAQLYKSPLRLILSGGAAFISLCVVCLIFFISPSIKLWVPLVPSALTFLGTGGVIVFISFRIR